MPCIFHDWSRWEDVDLSEELLPPERFDPALFMRTRMVIKQQKRCRRCNAIKTKVARG